MHEELDIMHVLSHSESTLSEAVSINTSAKRSGIFWPPGVSVPEVLHAVAIMHGSVTFN